jgi:hypothetical protein
MHLVSCLVLVIKDWIGSRIIITFVDFGQVVALLSSIH